MHLDFVVPGFSKCGTTTLCSLLGDHPQIFIPESKEPGFFAHNWHLGWDSYKEIFAPAAPGQLCGEGSTFYSSEAYSVEACRRINLYFPDAKFIFIARNPLDRIESSFREMHHSGYKYAIQADYSLGGTLRQLPNMIADTLYWARVNDFRREVRDSRILTLFLEDFKRQPLAELKKCYAFLGVDPDYCPADLELQLNPAGVKLYDAPLYRWIQNTQSARSQWDRIPQRLQQRLVKTFKLRRSFHGPIRWDSETLAWVLDQICDDSTAYLDWTGVPADFWDLTRPCE